MRQEAPHRALAHEGNRQVRWKDGLLVYFRGIYLYPPTIIGGDRERLVVTRRGRWKIVCARGAWWALLGGPSTSPLESAAKTRLESHEQVGAGAEDPSLGASLVRVRLAAVLLEVGARANADSICSSRACGAVRQARSGFVPSAVARLMGDYVVLACCNGAARAQ